ncbi:class I SAM-dependent methyltransferase [Paenibacillus polymyxa]|uniref:Type 11 methyltransferase n=1 Tax=Paenibacillus polymyxa TaxID=1406 RepID=A0A378Y0I8_PAEPO|nr:class I SAM-dependent methyltransferase [Paenibacillus polymyxa]MBE7896516.1 class I SAM-dependent methyltransferase [Paenibacillus polymyxa]MBG9765580.1 SAM-dependent methyltransferase [Paenibacillus polymyxa]MCC3257043.1 class I SAM-dependent methyltransferase [Paenibacillus polymyxa]QPK54490.1 class I SAM-dependent methyltransferase [Paenibacillus polymyxa]QPK59581.1 class I SAM-dependent methyltransferase [Paenibacillus polymyxa]
MKSIEYKEFYDKVGKTNGWDFSNVKYISEGVKWDFYNEVSKTCEKSDILLDIGTGGGEAILAMANSALLLVGIDQSTGMIETATKNSIKSDIANVRFLQMDAENLNFPREFFNVVSSRHSCFCAKEIVKVLVKGGIFLTQQVSENDKLNIKEAFGRGQALGNKKDSLKTQCITELNEAGFNDIQSFEFNATEYYQTPADLVFILKHTPIIPDFGQKQNDFEILQQFILDNQTPKGIRTNAERFMIVARK